MTTPPNPELKAAEHLQESATDGSTHTGNDRSVLSVIRDIQQGALAPRSLGVEDRRRCVEHLTGEGYSLAEIAEILKVTERTIARDRSAVRQSNAIERDEDITGEMVGQLVTQADTTINRIRRITRDSDTPPAARIEGEKACWVIARDLVQKLQSLGYLPNAPQEIRGQMTHQVEHLPAFGQMNEEVRPIYQHTSSSSRHGCTANSLRCYKTSAINGVRVWRSPRLSSISRARSWKKFERMFSSGRKRSSSTNSSTSSIRVVNNEESMRSDLLVGLVFSVRLERLRLAMTLILSDTYRTGPVGIASAQRLESPRIPEIAFGRWCRSGLAAG
ncbi:MAG: hypothetical protein V3T53_06660 [Phycisphaerales bacterium]